MYDFLEAQEKEYRLHMGIHIYITNYKTTKIGHLGEYEYISDLWCCKKLGSPWNSFNTLFRYSFKTTYKRLGVLNEQFKS